MRQIPRISDDAALVLWIPVKDIEGFSENLVRRHREQVLDGVERLQAGLVDVGDPAIGIAHHDVDGHVVEHLQLPFGLGLELRLFSRQFPGQHRSGVAAAAVHHRGHREVEGLAADRDARLVRQILRIGEQPALALRFFMEDVDRLAEQGVDLHRQHMLDLLEILPGGFVEVDDLEIGQLADHHADRHVIQQSKFAFRLETRKHQLIPQHCNFHGCPAAAP
ncbi:hypothetical protein [Bradyrhizobium sp. Leo170]|uniref:hypothetical protein n=1 Tax=Bradyrhizobium sp. Leo170 TaxID=1571199 RepID=UPI0010D1D697|nr:hypothetical protein [Bradyrhizobium sp. Leo170]TAI65572.1 hypothetical protein CWO89_12895 [Bradyrhizobium sp. Leo170]